MFFLLAPDSNPLPLSRPFPRMKTCDKGEPYYALHRQHKDPSEGPISYFSKLLPLY